MADLPNGLTSPSVKGSTADQVLASQFATLRVLGDLLAQPLVRRTGLAGAVLVPVRRLARLLARSWLYVQTRFNHALVDQLERLHAELPRDRAALRADAAEHAERLALRQATALDALRDALLDQVRDMARQEAEALEALRGAVTRYLPPEPAEVARLGRRLLHLEAKVALQQRHLTWLVDELRNAFPKADRERARLIALSQPSDQDDALSAFIQDEFRGSRVELKQRARVYLPILVEARLGTGGDLTVDLGCGRGEWLEVLKEEGTPGRGVDSNRLFIDECRQRGLDVTEADALAYLVSVPDDSLGAVTAFHLIEHLPLDVALALIDEALRTLKPGGVAIFETPNPENVLVATHDFYLDPTHRKPIPSALLRRLLESRGFARVDVLSLNPPPETVRVQESALETTRRFNQHFYGARDYAVLGWKSRQPSE